jgi:hypothetical protein
MRRIGILGLAFVCGCFLTGRSAFDRLADKQCEQASKEMRTRTAYMEQLAQTGSSKMDLYQAIQTLRGDLSTAKGKCADSVEARAEIEGLERRVDRLEHEFILNPGSPR